MTTRFVLALLAAQALFAAVNYSYDASGRLTKIDYGAGVSISYTYDKAGNLLSRTVTPSAGAGAPAVIGSQQAFGTGNVQSFTFQFAHSGGAQNLAVLNVLINNFLDGRKACYLAYVVSSSTLILIDDLGEAGGPYAGSVALGNPSTAIQNSQCSVNLISAGAGADGNTFNLGLNITFKTAFGGNRIQYLAARDNGSGNTDWQAMGVWQPPFSLPGTISVTNLDQGRAAPAGTPEILKITLADTKGTGDFGVINVLINNFIDGRKGCYLAYSTAMNALLLVDDTGDAGGPFAGTMPMTGATAPISNSQCSVSPTGTSVSSNGNTLMLTLNITAKSGLAGNRVVWIAGRDKADGNNTDWQALGTWSVQ